MTDARFRIEVRAARRARRWVMIDNLVGISDLSQGLAFVTLLPARFLPRTFAQARHPRRLLQSIARWRLAAVRTVQTKPALKFGDMRFQSRDLGRLCRDQRNQLFPRWLGRRIRIHRILESNPDSDVQKNLRARLRQTAYPTWAETFSSCIGPQNLPSILTARFLFAKNAARNIGMPCGRLPGFRRIVVLSLIHI